MKKVHVVVPDLFLPSSLAKNVCTGLHVPALEKLLARSMAQPLSTHTLEAWLCEAFSVPYPAIAPVTLLADGLKPESDYWLRADPVHLRLDRDQMILQTNVSPSKEEAEQLCAYLNQHFSESGMRFVAPHPQRWYLHLKEDPQLTTHPVCQVEGRNSRRYMPEGKSALKWHGLMNEIQMALYGHALYQAHEARGAVPINSLWLWGGGRAVALSRPFDLIGGDSDLAKAFAQAADITQASALQGERQFESALYVCAAPGAALRRGDFHAWREAVGRFEQDVLSPLLHTLGKGGIDRISLDTLQEEGSHRYELTRPMLWKLWKRVRPLSSYSLV